MANVGYVTLTLAFVLTIYATVVLSRPAGRPQPR